MKAGAAASLKATAGESLGEKYYRCIQEGWNVAGHSRRNVVSRTAASVREQQGCAVVADLVKKKQQPQKPTGPYSVGWNVTEHSECAV